ncbi:MAG TPA: DUF2516 family protein [Micromonosporaceae bacterium]|jgi:hypothetical protein
MASGALFYLTVTRYVFYVVTIVALVVEIWALAHCATRRSAAFGAVGSIPKGAWVALTAGALVLTVLFGIVGSALGAIAVAVALVYLLDVRPALRDAVDGRGGW